jgi:hypothetical protein
VAALVAARNEGNHKGCAYAPGHSCALTSPIKKGRHTPARERWGIEPYAELLGRSG